jgi:ketosteroid isomerase-like protein
MEPRKLQQLCDERDIQEVLVRYCRGSDRCDVDLVKSAYWPDAIDDHLIFNGNAMEFADFLIDMFLTHVHRTVHTISNVWIRLDGDAAAVETYVHAYHLMKGEGKGVEAVMAGRYLDRFERRDGEWRIAERKCVPDWEKNCTALLDPDTLNRLMTADLRRPNDQSYELFARTTSL